MQNETNKQKQTISPSIIFVIVFIVGIGAVFGLLGYLVSETKENIIPVTQKPSVKVTDEITDDYFGNDFIQVKSPQKNATVKNPVLISGKANVDEANVRVKITDDNENILADTFITADGWMDKLYLFEKEITYNMPSSQNGLIEIFEESAKDGSEIYKIEIPVVFEDYNFKEFVNQNTRTIKLYYYNKSYDPEFDCKLEAVLSVTREIPITNTPIQDTIELLIKGKITEQERLAGFSSEFTNHPEKFKLLGTNLKNGVLTLKFTEVPSFTTGGSCRIGLLSQQILKTAKQFVEVERVVFSPDEIFQP